MAQAKRGSGGGRKKKASPAAAASDAGTAASAPGEPEVTAAPPARKKPGRPKQAREPKPAPEPVQAELVDGEPVEAEHAEDRDDDLVADAAQIADAALPEIEDVEEGEPAAIDVPQVEEAEPAAPASTRGLTRADPLTAYVQEIRRYPLLTREEEHELAKKFVETQDPELAKRLITANLRLVVKIAHEYRRAHRNLLDLVQEGNVGLMQAVRKYDPMRGVKLSSYAAWWIRAYILKFILNNWRMVKIGTTQAQRKLFFNLRKEKEEIERMGFTPDHKLLAERLDVTEAEVAEMDQRLAAGDASLDAPYGSSDDGDARTRLDVLPDAPGSRPDQAVAGAEFRQILRDKLEAFAATLKGREETLFRERWLTEEPKTLQEIGDSFGISRERARQLEKRMLDRLRDYLQAEFGTNVDIGAMVEE